MPVYESRGKRYNIPEDRVGQFLGDRKDAVLVDNTPYYLRRNEASKDVTNKDGALNPTGGLSNEEFQRLKSDMNAGKGLEDYQGNKDNQAGFKPFSYTASSDIDLPKKQDIFNARSFECR